LPASYLAYAKVSQGAVSFAPRSIAWWVAVVNLLGSIAFQVSALYSLAGPELFDEQSTGNSSPAG
jgi:hypothetical protein